MNENIKKLIEKMELNHPATKEGLNVAELESGIKFPAQYVDFISEFNGAEGNVGENSYLAIWPIEDIAQYNADYEVEKYTPSLVYFGSDGGGEAFAFDKSTSEAQIVMIPFTSIHIEDAILCGNTFNEFLQYLYDAE